MKRAFKFWLYRWVFPYAGVALVKALAATYRIRIVDPEGEQMALQCYQNLIYAVWHQRFFPGIALFLDRKPIAVMISQSRDGEMIARVAEKFGWEPVRGSSTRGGVAALRKLRSLAQQGYNFAHIVDGPKGPFGKVKPGLLHLARMVGKPIVPTTTSAEKRWVFNSWDRFMVPKPFSRILIRFGDPIDMPPKIDSEAFEQKRRLVEKSLEKLNEDTDHLWEEPKKLAAVFTKHTP